MKWSVGLQAESDRELSREEIVELADAVAVADGFATGVGTNYYGAQIMVTATTRDAAVAKATELFERAAAQAGLPHGPIVRIEISGEEDDELGDEMFA